MSAEDSGAIILAGGKSSRMGRPKALLEFDNAPLIVHLVKRLRDLFDEILIVAAPEQELPALPARLVRDEVAHQGPVGGIYYGLQATEKEICFVTSCDVAFLNPALISHFLRQVVSYDVVVPYWEERFQPLHAVYRKRSALPFLKEQLERGELRPIYLYDKVRTLKIGEDEIRSFDPEGLSFLNMNTPSDYEAAVVRWNRLNGAADAVDHSVHCIVELFGSARLLAKRKEIALSLPEDATLGSVFSLLLEKLPMLAHRVIAPDGSGLASGCACNLNGLDFVRALTTKVNTGDKILIFSADAGG